MRDGPRRAGPGPAATLHDVAREAGVSVATASRALNGSSRSVRQENISRVLSAAAKLNYEPHLSAQAIAVGSTRTAALVVSDVGDPYFSSIAAGVCQVAEAAGLIVTMAVSDRSPERELQIVRTLRGHRPRVIIVAGSRVDGSGTRQALVDELVAYRAAGGSVVMISQQDLPFTTVSIDNFEGARQLARALVDQGYRRFAVIRATDLLRTSRDRYNGFLAGLGEVGIGLDDRYVVEADFTRDGGYAAVRELLQRAQPEPGCGGGEHASSSSVRAQPEPGCGGGEHASSSSVRAQLEPGFGGSGHAPSFPGRGASGMELVFAVNDVMAIGAMTALRDAGLVPGADLAVAGFDDISSAVDLAPALTSVAVPLQKVGRSAMKLALREDGTPKVVQVPTSVILRDSTPRRHPTPGSSR